MLYLTATTIAFVLTLIIVEVRDSTDDDITTRPISHYFSTATAIAQDIAFVAMAVALWYTAYELGISWMGISLALVGCGLLAAMSSDTWPKLFFGLDRQVHYTGSALCFISGLSMMLAGHSVLFATAYVLVALLLFAIDRVHTAVQEKVGVLMLVIWVLGYSISLQGN